MNTTLKHEIEKELSAEHSRFQNGDTLNTIKQLIKKTYSQN